MKTIISQAVASAAERLSRAGVEDPAQDAWILTNEVVRRTGGDQPLTLHDEVEPDAAGLLEQWVGQRELRRPVSQIIGRRWFYESEFHVSADVLDPRPESETLVETGLAGRPRRILDLGTGSGCLLLSLLIRLPGATGVGVDKSVPALGVARSNCRRYNLCGRALFMQSDWYSEVTGTFDLVIANPPYLSAHEYSLLPPELSKWEPRLALTDGGDGLAAYREIAGRAAAHLTATGRLVLELGAGQVSRVANIVAEHGLSVERVVHDLDQRPRALVAFA